MKRKTIGELLNKSAHRDILPDAHGRMPPSTVRWYGWDTPTLSRPSAWESAAVTTDTGRVSTNSRIDVTPTFFTGTGRSKSQMANLMEYANSRVRSNPSRTYDDLTEDVADYWRMLQMNAETDQAARQARAEIERLQAELRRNEWANRNG